MRFPCLRLLIFAKAPVPGQAKTRLIPALGARGAAVLHDRMVRYTLIKAVGTRLCPVELHCAPDTHHPVFAELQRTWSIVLRPQVGADLGERMYRAARKALSASTGVVLIGTDCPALTPEDLAHACQVLNRGDDAVIVPAEDGGYVLLGLRSAAIELFREMPWGGDRVCCLTCERMTRLGWRWRQLETRWDVDAPEDLPRLRHALGWSIPAAE